MGGAVYIDANSNNQYDHGEPNTTTDGDGSYASAASTPDDGPSRVSRRHTGSGPPCPADGSMKHYLRSGVDVGLTPLDDYTPAARSGTTSTATARRSNGRANPVLVTDWTTHVRLRQPWTYRQRRHVRPTLVSNARRAHPGRPLASDEPRDDGSMCPAETAISRWKPYTSFAARSTTTHTATAARRRAGLAGVAGYSTPTTTGSRRRARHHDDCRRRLIVLLGVPTGVCAFSPHRPAAKTGIEPTH